MTTLQDPHSENEESAHSLRCLGATLRRGSSGDTSKGALAEDVFDFVEEGRVTVGGLVFDL